MKSQRCHVRCEGIAPSLMVPILSWLMKGEGMLQFPFYYRFFFFGSPDTQDPPPESAYDVTTRLVLILYIEQRLPMIRHSAILLILNLIM
jgi:hypothetical protein